MENKEIPQGVEFMVQAEVQVEEILARGSRRCPFCRRGLGCGA